MCMWVKDDVCASCEAVRGDEAVQIRKEACVMCERGFRQWAEQYWWKEEVMWEWHLGILRGGKGY